MQMEIRCVYDFAKSFPGLQYKTTALINHKLASLALVKHQVPCVQDVCLNTPDQTDIKLSVTWLYDTHGIRMDSSRHQSLHYHCVSLTHFNSYDPGRSGNNFKNNVFKFKIRNSSLGTHCESKNHVFFLFMKRHLKKLSAKIKAMC